jgi:thioredoxin 1
MKHFNLFFLLAAALITMSCSNQPNNTKLIASEFEAKIGENPEAPVIDVRTPAEFSEGHLTSAVNYDWNGDAFHDQVAGLDKSKPVFVYCKSGKRSGEAAAAIRTEGFLTVYELEGGITAWRSAGLPEVKGQ